VAAVGVLALLAPAGGMEDPRDRDNVVLGGGPLAAPTGARAQLAAPADRLRETVGEGDLLYPFASVFLSGLPATGDAVTLPYSQTTLLESAVDRVDWPAGAVVVAIPTGEAAVDETALAAALGEGYDVQVFPAWLLVRAEGPFAEPDGALAAIVAALNAALESVDVDRYQELRFYVERSLRTACQALLGDTTLERCEAPGAAG
jgi:hypothetical protein